MVEHDEATIAAADHVIDIGPEAGNAGSAFPVSGRLKELREPEASLTGPFLVRGRAIRRSEDGSRRAIAG